MQILIVVLLVLNAALAVWAIFNSRRGKDPAEDLKPELNSISSTLQGLEKYLRDDIQRLRADQMTLNAEIRRELSASLQGLNDTVSTENRKNREETTSTLNALRLQINTDAQKNREELGKALDNLSESLSRRLQELTGTQQTQFEALRTALEGRMEQIRTNNEQKLEEMRRTVDEKLHETLEKRLGESFRIVSERLELVHKGLGEMRELANGVGDLKKVLGNVKTRGVLGEVQLEAILEQMLTPEQYVKNFKPHKRRDELVEFAIRLPGRDEDQEAVYLPLDSKFPQDMYHQLVDSLESANSDAIANARRKLYTAVRGFAKDIRDKYLNPPVTTDFGLMFLPFEGLFAEVIRDPALFEEIRRQYQVIIVGPTTLAALMNSLQMGFRTLAIEKRSSEVWKILSAVKAEFGQFGMILEKTQKKLQEASNVIDKAHQRSRVIQRKLNKVQDMPVEESVQLLELEAEPEELEDTEDGVDTN